ncbi:alpha/beta hydrolase family protein [Microbacterium telephonicum]|uniref:Putative dienelactone hydrolase n=1 Tax=Microbacterium telephonicum TaxID=1714841 RepID=A0A498CLJ6_9MICO|nr:alpha/beta hydrolase [Microbacterium telephonicum]RLK52841.1 putative dienelactone hydrolase [Microbacterium telephonicum]
MPPVIVDGSRPRWDGPGDRPIRLTLWEPRGDGPHPLVLLSHGTGGRVADLGWLADALAAAGILVAGVDHHGNTAADDAYLPEGFAFVWERPRDLSVVIDHLLDTRDDVDAGRIGAAGFSLGGYTCIALLGGRIDPHIALAVITGAAPMPPLPEFPDLIARLGERHTADDLRHAAQEAAASARDERVRGAFAIAPSIGPLLDTASLAEITAPLAVRWGDADDNAVPAQNALRYLEVVPTASGVSLGAGVGHYEFLAGSPDPEGARGRVAADAVAFFRDLFAPGRMAP